ncbi:MAG: STAS-like domain-containing protein, partial [Planctomycetota bacterium]
IVSEGSGRAIVYKLQETKYHFKLEVSSDLDEGVIWRERVQPTLPSLEENIIHICNYGFTEMFNNVIEHSESKDVTIHVEYDALKVKFWVFDSGIGIFNKIQKVFKLEDPRYAILELAKGKLTTDPKKHTGEGIFFTSRMFDKFIIFSQKLYFSGHKNDDWLLEDDKKITKGTVVCMEINRDSSLKMKNIFDEYASPSKDDYGFSRTIVPVKLLQFEGEVLISRSQAKQLITRFERFKEVILDFEGIKLIGQPFADEIFRVFQKQHPKVHLIPVKTNKDVEKTIRHVLDNH